MKAGMQGAYLHGIRRRVVYVGLYEFFAIILSAILLQLLSDGGATTSLVLAVIASAAAIIWNLIFNSLFEHWEAKRKQQGRSLALRLFHAVGVEGGLVLLIVPLLAWQLKISLLEALLMDIGLLLFFLVYTFVFTWLFDRVFGLPSAVQGACV